jgi:hypothetical protein
MSVISAVPILSRDDAKAGAPKLTRSPILSGCRGGGGYNLRKAQLDRSIPGSPR